MQSHKELIVWQKGIELVKTIYALTKTFPKSEVFSPSNQMRRAVVSIPSNIAEGYLRGSSQEYVRFLGIALGSVAELETQLIIAKELGFGSKNELKNAELLIVEILKILSVIIKKLRVSTS